MGINNKQNNIGQNRATSKGFGDRHDDIIMDRWNSGELGKVVAVVILIIFALYFITHIDRTDPEVPPDEVLDNFLQSSSETKINDAYSNIDDKAVEAADKYNDWTNDKTNAEINQAAEDAIDKMENRGTNIDNNP